MPALVETFDNFPVGEWVEGSIHGNWVAAFNSNGLHGVIVDGSNVLRQKPEFVSGQTRSTLAVTTQSLYSVDVTARMKTVAQNEPTAPNTWERAWLITAFRDNANFYYVTLKTNGIEVGKRDPNYGGGQRFLPWYQATNWPVGVWNTVRMRLSPASGGTKIEVWVDGVLQPPNPTTFIDTERPLISGKVGLYNEDSEVRFDDVSILGATGGGVLGWMRRKTRQMRR